MNANEIRELLKSKNITFENITMYHLIILRDILNRKLIESNIYNGTARIDKLINHRLLTISTIHWKGREAVSFNKDGFVGFCGWASSENAKPIYDAVIEWANTFD